MDEQKVEKDLVVEESHAEVRIALMENHRLIELNRESNEGHSFSVGSVFLGRVKKLLPALNAAFVDIGDSKEAFIHYLDLGFHFTAFDTFVRESNPNKNLKDLYSSIKLGPVLGKEGRIEDHLKVGQMIIAQIVKEPISTKGSRLTAEISLAGRNIVLMPFADKVNVSQKISSKEEKKRLETLVKSILPKNYGAIIRTAAEGKNASVLVAEVQSLIDKWESSWKKIAKNKIGKHAAAIEKETGFKIDIDDKVYTSILFSEGGKVDARTISSRAETFLDDELFELLRLLSADRFTDGIEKLESVSINVDLPADNPEIMSMYVNESESKVLVAADDKTVETCRNTCETSALSRQTARRASARHFAITRSVSP